MQNTGYVALSYAVGLERKMDMVANNVANVDTNGYKSTHMLFEEYMVKARDQKPLSMVEDVGNYKNFQPGPIQQTGNPLDVALEGNGFMSVTTPQGKEYYTRNGGMHLNQTGQLVNGAGNIVNDVGGKPITIPAGSGQVTITGEGAVNTDQGVVGRLKIVSFDNPQALKPVGNDMYETDQAGNPDAKTKVTQGAVEGSNVNAVMEMTDMIEVSRKYESVARILQDQHDSQIGMIQRLSKIQ